LSLSDTRVSDTGRKRSRSTNNQQVASHVLLA
jgi:hypothetical protein